MKAIIADDEPALRQHLRERLQDLWPDLEICAVVEDGEQAFQAFTDHRPDICFLDIRMPGLSGLEVARRIAQSCHIVFVTAYDQYAVDAFEQNAIDYLLKPYTEERLQETIERLKRLRENDSEATSLEAVLDKLDAVVQQSPKENLQWIRASVGDDIQMVHVDEIVYFCADAKYTSAFTKNKEYLIRTPLKELEQNLDGDRFWRIHRSCIVSVSWIDHAKRLIDGRYILFLRDLDKELSVSRAYAHLFKQM